MAKSRENPYLQFNFTVDLGDGVAAGFQECSNIGMEVTVAEYRDGNYPLNNVRKFTGLNKAADITLKRGVIGDLSLFTWLKGTREGTFDPRTVTVSLLDEARSPVCSWILQQAQPTKWVGPTLTAKGGGQVAVEELHLVAERIDFQST